MLKKTMLVSLIVAISSPFLASAADLTIVNNTNRDSTSVINHGACSTILGSHGITPAHSTNVVPSKIVTFACLLNRSNCRADVYMTNNCSGPVIATASFDVNSGIKSIDILDPSFTVSYSGFAITISGGPA